MVLVASSRSHEIVQFEDTRSASSGVTMTLVTSDEALAARQSAAVAALQDAASFEAFLALRARKPTMENWRGLQRLLFSAVGGGGGCPISGTPVLNLEACSERLAEATWVALEALQKAINKKEAAAEFTAALATLAPLVAEHVAAQAGAAAE